MKRASVASLCLLVVISVPGLAQVPNSSQTVFVGCLSRIPQGTLQLGTVPSGKVYLLAGNTEPLMAHVNQIVRVVGRAESNAAPEGVSKITVDSMQVVAQSCTAALPPSKTVSVEGKAGEDQIAVPVTSTASSNENTPGFQTESGQSPRPGGARSSGSEHPATPPYAPFEAEQTAQSESAANVNAEAAARAEILPEKTLGAAVGVPNAPAASAGPNSNPAPGGSSPGGRVVVVDITGDGIARLSRERVSIRAGETVQWKNSSGGIHEIVGNPAKARGHLAPSLPAGASPFDSGFVRPDHSFSYRFTVLGVYRYILDPSGGQPLMGEIVVSQ